MKHVSIGWNVIFNLVDDLKFKDIVFGSLITIRLLSRKYNEKGYPYRILKELIEHSLFWDGRVLIVPFHGQTINIDNESKYGVLKTGILIGDRFIKADNIMGIVPFKNSKEDEHMERCLITEEKFKVLLEHSMYLQFLEANGLEAWSQTLVNDFDTLPQEEFDEAREYWLSEED